MNQLPYTQEIEFEKPTQDGTFDRTLLKMNVKQADSRMTVAHGLRRVPVKCFVVKSVGGYPVVKVSLDSNGREQADAEKITLEFSATGNALVCFE